jgi:hypothetical protein
MGGINWTPLNYVTLSMAWSIWALAYAWTNQVLKQFEFFNNGNSNFAIHFLSKTMVDHNSCGTSHNDGAL